VRRREQVVLQINEAELERLHMLTEHELSRTRTAARAAEQGSESERFLKAEARQLERLRLKLRKA
jgi:hypothetical protein